MKSFINILLILTISILFSCSDSKTKYKKVTLKDSSGYSYEAVEGDVMNSRIYTLSNGLKVYLTDNKNEPRILTLIAVKAGSTYDPAETTGLAHYLEHMMFKGTDKIGTINWEEEEKLLNQISDLFEEHKNTSNVDEKRLIYKKIDSLSTVAASYAIPSEYDKMMSLIGAKGTNAYTSNEETVYMNDIPSNEIERWLKIESERFSKLVLRLFHTELETVYEEFNMVQDNDRRKMWEAMYSGLFPGHPYGEQTTIGKGEHLKNPSMVNIHNYFNKYYRPNNMAICLSGDLNMEETIKLIDKYWGGVAPNNELEHPTFSKLEPINEVIKKEVFGPSAESINIGFRLDGIKSDDVKKARILSRLLTNGQAGLIDINLVQKQQVLEAWSSASFLNDYGMLILSGNPRQGQELDEVKNLLLEQLQKIKDGDFEEWMLSAIINQYKISELRQLESNWRAFRFVNAFVRDLEWIDLVKEIDEYDKITKDEIISFANLKFADNYVSVYKKTGKSEDVMKVEKPEITPLDINRTSESDFMAKIKSFETSEIQPVFLNYKELISEDVTSGHIPFRYIKNHSNELFSLNYIIDMGKYHDKKLALAVEYLPYIGTEKYSPEELRKELYKYGLSLNVYTGNKRSYVFISGLDQYLEKGIEILEEVLSKPKADQKSYNDFVDGILKERLDAKLDKNTMFWSALTDYGKYEGQSPFTDFLSEEELKNINPEELMDILKGIFNYKHHIFYYGSLDMKDVNNNLTKLHIVPEELKDYPQPKVYKERSFDKKQVFFSHYEQVQTNIYLLSKDVLFNVENYPYQNLFNQYYGSGLSSIVFQEIREAKGFAYASFANYTTPAWPDEYHYVTAYVATQPDKISDAVNELLKLLNNMARAEKQFEASKEGIIKQIQTSRITKESIFWNYLSANDKGYDYDIRMKAWEVTPNITQDRLEEFFNNHIKDKNYIVLVQGDRSTVDFNVLKQFGTVEEVPIEVLYGY